MEKPQHEKHLMLQECEDPGSNFYLPGGTSINFGTKITCIYVWNVSTLRTKNSYF